MEQPPIAPAPAAAADATSATAALEPGTAKQALPNSVPVDMSASATPSSPSGTPTPVLPTSSPPAVEAAWPPAPVATLNTLSAVDLSDPDPFHVNITAATPIDPLRSPRPAGAGHLSKPSDASSVSFEEVGFDDAASAWTEAPSFASTATVGTGAMSPGTPGATGGWSRPGSTHSSPAKYASGVSVSTSGSRSLGALGTLGQLHRTSTSTSATGSLMKEGDIPLVLGVAVVDFNHLIGPTVEYAYPASLQDALQADDGLARILPFLALPDGAHLSEEDYSYFHCIYSPPPDTPPTDIPPNRTLFGISCNRQIAAADLLRRTSDVTRSMVQKAVIVLASQPVFGPVKDRLGVVTRAFFAQRDFGSTQILQDFYESLEMSLEGKAGESAIYMGTSLRELVHKFRHRTLVLLKMLVLQKRIMLFGYPVEKLCTYQYSLVSLIPGLLMSLRDSGSPLLDARTTRTRPTSLRTSDRQSLLRYMGLPLHLFGSGAMFQPYLPLQQMDLLQARSWLVGTTNQIVTQQRDCKYDVLVNIDHTTFEFADPKLERMVALTAADRKWMDDIVKTVEDSWNMPEGERPGFIGSDDDLRNRFEEYLCAFLATVKYTDFVRTQGGPVPQVNPLIPFGEAFTASFRATPAFDIWDSTTDEVIFDLSEPRHPCDGKVTAVADIGIRLSEGLHELRIDETLAPTREALTSAGAAVGSTLFRAFDGVRTEVSSRLEAERARRAASSPTRASPSRSPGPSPVGTPTTPSPPPSATSATGPAPASTVGSTLSSVGSSVSSFFGSRWTRPQPERRSSGLRPMSLTPETLQLSSSPRKR